MQSAQSDLSFCWVQISFCWFSNARQNMYSGFPTKQDSNQSPQLERQAIKLKFILLQILVRDILSIKQITKAMLSMRGCADWSVPLLFAIPRRLRFSRVEAHMYFKTST